MLIVMPCDGLSIALVISERSKGLKYKISAESPYLYPLFIPGLSFSH